MTEEVKPVEGQEGQSEQQEVQKPVELSPIEQQALEMGWKPKEQFEGSEDEFIDAKEFVRRKPLFDRLDQQSKQLKNVTKTLEQLKSHYTKMREVEFNRALAELKAARKQSVTDSDGDRFEVLDDRIKQIEKEADKLKEEDRAVNAPDPAEFNQWVSKNSWYQKDEAMTAFADRVGLKYQQSVLLGELTPLEVLEKVSAQVRAEFPHKFRNPNKDTAPNVVEGKGNSRKTDSFELDPTERKVMENFVRLGVMTKDQYIKDLKKAKGIE